MSIPLQLSGPPDEQRAALCPLTETPFSLLGATTGGVWTSADVAAAQVSPALARQLVRTGEWQRLHRWTYARGGLEPDARMSAWAAVLAVGAATGASRPLRALATGRTAARVLGLPLIGCKDSQDVLVAASRQVRGHPGIRVVHRSPPFSVLFSDGLPLAAPPLVALDVVPLLGDRALVCLLDAMLHHELLDVTELPATGRWSLRLRTVAALADGRAESPLETLGRLAARDVLPDLEPQVPVRGKRLDLACRRLAVALEGDGAGTHSGPVSLLADRRREEGLGGWRFLRYGWDDVWPSPVPLQRRLRAFLAALS